MRVPTALQKNPLVNNASERAVCGGLAEGCLSSFNMSKSMDSIEHAVEDRVGSVYLATRVLTEAVLMRAIII